MFDTLLINLDSSLERLEFQKQQLKALNIAFHRLKAVSVDDLTSEDYEKFSNDWGRKLRKTEVACFLSHYQAWLRVIELNKPALILEDDIILSKKTTEVLERIPFVKDNYHHINLETRGRKKLLGKKQIPLDKDYSLYRLYQDRTGSAAYLLTPLGAKILLAHKEKYGVGLVDAQISSCYALRSFQIVPALAIQSDQCNYYGVQTSFSTSSVIGKENKVDRYKISTKDKILFKIRRIRIELRIGWRLLKKIIYANREFVEIRKNDF